MQRRHIPLRTHTVKQSIQTKPQSTFQIYLPHRLAKQYYKAFPVVSLLSKRVLSSVVGLVLLITSVS